MDLFRVETGAIPGQSCSEEAMPILNRSPRKDEHSLSSKAFLINNSLACIANISLTFADPSNKAKGYPIKPTSPIKQNSKPDPPKSPEYRQLSPKNLEDPIWPNGKNNLHATGDDSETEYLLEKNNNVLNIGEKRDCRSSSKQFPKDEIESKQSSTILAGFVASQPDQPSISSACLSGDSPPVLGKKKTLGELAKEWNANQNPGQTKAEGTIPEKTVQVSDPDEDEQSLVRHSTYYSTSSSVHGMSSRECRLKNKLKARRHLNDDEVYQERKTSSPALIKLHASTTIE